MSSLEVSRDIIKGLFFYLANNGFTTYDEYNNYLGVPYSTMKTNMIWFALEYLETRNIITRRNKKFENTNLLASIGIPSMLVLVYFDIEVSFQMMWLYYLYKEGKCHNFVEEYIYQSTKKNTKVSDL